MAKTDIEQDGRRTAWVRRQGRPMVGPLGGHRGHAPWGVRVRHRRASAGKARPPAVTVHGRPPLRDRARGGRLQGDLHRRPHPLAGRAPDAADAWRAPDHVPVTHDPEQQPAAWPL